MFGGIQSVEMDADDSKQDADTPDSIPPLTPLPNDGGGNANPPPAANPAGSEPNPPDLKTCLYCCNEIPRVARLCHYCNRYQTRFAGFLNHISTIEMVIAFGMMLVSVWQLREAVKERVGASEALEKASSAQQAAAQVAQEVLAIRDRVEGYETDIAAVSDKAQEATTQLDTLRSTLAVLDARSNDAKHLIASLDERAAIFDLGNDGVVEASRKAYEELKRIDKEDKNPLTRRAARAEFVLVQREMESGRSLLASI